MCTPSKSSPARPGEHCWLLGAMLTVWHNAMPAMRPAMLPNDLAGCLAEQEN
jgi:hypothetical protein